MFDIFSIAKIIFIVVAVILIIRNYRIKNFKDIPNTLIIVCFFSISLIYEFIPQSIKTPFVYLALIIGFFAPLLASNFYRKRNDKFRQWFYIVFAIIICILFLLNILGVIEY